MHFSLRPPNQVLVIGLGVIIGQPETFWKKSTHTHATGNHNNITDLYLYLYFMYLCNLHLY